ncbi:MAG: glycosyltransferase N-terminal domain-containing protein [bacterium]|nr:glycosyltransferase N-terminal domain-containing protein [bacterium]
MIKFIYRIIFFILLPFGILGFLLIPRGRKYLKERLGFWGLETSQAIVWFHGSSLGELRGILPILLEIKKNYPELKSLVTTTTQSGREFLEGKCDFPRMLPLDIGIFYAHAISNINVKILIVSETEIWPALLWFVKERNIKSVLINGRISDSSWPTYKRFRWFFRDLLSSFERICAADQISKERFLDLGFNANQIILTGNSKYDFDPIVKDTLLRKKLKESFFSTNQLIVSLGSLRPGEESIWFPAIKEILAKFNGRIGVIIAPRHPEKFQFFAEALNSYQMPFTKWSKIQDLLDKKNQIILLDTLGELEKCYSFSDLAFIGGSIGNYGGHNPLEAAAYGVALCMGPSIFSVREIVKELKANSGLLDVNNVEQAKSVLRKLLEEPTEIIKIGQQSKIVFESFKGAKDKVLKVLNPMLEGHKSD